MTRLAGEFVFDFVDVGANGLADEQAQLTPLGVTSGESVGDITADPKSRCREVLEQSRIIVETSRFLIGEIEAARVGSGVESTTQLADGELLNSPATTRSRPGQQLPDR